MSKCEKGRKLAARGGLQTGARLCLTDQREQAFERSPELEQAWFAELAEAEGSQAFLNGTQNYPQLKGVQTNLYKCFLPRAWVNVNGQGVSGFLHPEGIYDDPKGGGFRREVYRRLRGHFQFANAFFLFAEVHDQTRFGINVYGPIFDVPEVGNTARAVTSGATLSITNELE